MGHICVSAGYRTLREWLEQNNCDVCREDLRSNKSAVSHLGSQNTNLILVHTMYNIAGVPALGHSTNAHHYQSLDAESINGGELEIDGLSSQW